MNTAYRLALSKLLPRFLSETDALGERLVIAAPAPNEAFVFTEDFCLLAPERADVQRVASQGHELKIYWETGEETIVDVLTYPLDQTRFKLSFTVPANAQVGRLYGKFRSATDTEYTIAPLQIVVRQ